MITNNVFNRRRIMPEYVWWKNAFSSTQLNNIEYLSDNIDLQNAKVVFENNQENSNPKVRISKVHFFDRNDDTYWIFDTFNNVIQSINDQFYQFDLYGYDTFQYTTYFGNEKGKYDWHMDTVIGNNIPEQMQIGNTRKLTLVMLLNERSEFTGGDFQINNGREYDAMTVHMERGTIIAFPSFMIHRVTPVLSGIRKSIVIWVEGPKFR